MIELLLSHSAAGFEIDEIFSGLAKMLQWDLKGER